VLFEKITDAFGSLLFREDGSGVYAETGTIGG
jgi:hypothetical protein